jgi:hypothetical protein
MTKVVVADPDVRAAHSDLRVKRAVLSSDQRTKPWEEKSDAEKQNSIGLAEKTSEARDKFEQAVEKSAEANGFSNPKGTRVGFAVIREVDVTLNDEHKAKMDLIHAQATQPDLIPAPAQTPAPDKARAENPPRGGFGNR